MTRLTDERLAELADKPQRTWFDEVPLLIAEAQAWREASLDTSDCNGECADHLPGLLATARRERDEALAAADTLRTATELVKSTALMGYTAREAITDVATAIAKLGYSGLLQENERLARELHQARESARGREEEPS